MPDDQSLQSRKSATPLTEAERHRNQVKSMRLELMALIQHLQARETARRSFESMTAGHLLSEIAVIAETANKDDNPFAISLLRIAGKIREVYEAQPVNLIGRMETIEASLFSFQYGADQMVSNGQHD
jgi:hypothetical protein